ncbi:MAG: aminotransferase class V-fold PLP-dependent enzyme [Ignavibacteriales bacterium]|nr:aminotransferase class V-fold PLP-dependent enzyme [Ignavibacteriales bacterium]
MKELLLDTARRSIHYREEILNRSVVPTAEAIKQLKKFDIPFPQNPSTPENVINMLDEIGSPATMGISGRRFFGFVIGGSLPAAVAASWLSTAWDQNAGLFVGSPIGIVLEEVSLKWLLEIFGLPSESGGSFVTGATMANFTALAAARHSILKNEGWDVEANGLFGAPPIDVIVGEEAHPSLFRGLSLLGLGRERVKKVPVDNQGRINPDKFPEIKGPTIVCVQAGNVNTGSFDPIRKICEISKSANAWVHVDGAFGLWASVVPSKKYLTDGINLADSWATDAHKWLNVPYDSGLAFVKNSESLRSALSLTAAYLPQGGHREPSQYSPELSRRSRGIEVWAALYSLGKSGLSDMIERTCNYAGMFAAGLSKAGFEILNEVVINQVLVSFGTPDETKIIIKELQEDGTCWCGITEWQGRTAMRISISSWATTEEDVQKSLEAMIRIAKKVREYSRQQV